MNNLKRFFILFLCVSVITSTFILNVSATSTESNDILSSYWYDVLDSAGANVGDQTYWANSATTVNRNIVIPFNRNITFNGFDFLFKSDGVVTSVRYQSQVYPCYLVTDDIYRCFGTFPSSVKSNVFNSTVNFSNTSFIEIIGFRLLLSSNEPIHSFITFESESDGFSVVNTQTAPFQALRNNFESWSSDAEDPQFGNKSWSVNLSLAEWYLFDSISYFCNFNVASIDSIYCKTSTGLQVPIEITPVNIKELDYVDTESGGSVKTAMNGSFYVTIDVSDIPRSTSYRDRPIVYINGSFQYIENPDCVSSYGMFFEVSHSDCFYERQNLNPFLVRLKVFFTTLEQGITRSIDDLYFLMADIFVPDSTVVDNIDSAQQEIDEELVVFDSVETPNLDGINFDFIFVDNDYDSNVIPFGAFFLTILNSNSLIYYAILLSLVFGLFGFIIYGQR